ncbi:hypothetical protein C9374_006618 [Naegleria lovaniensis]|uniref:Methyltransferase domain-containing protein n=1 Tax=Naegleria lovaniensis TaxID=51637 RepID=A0AA88GLT8_NAELO|nr:uncharacterized protein C9374_006618 [Naegleria lovaniensis]KAG2379501.1 hypothetical protein C9374_006618 [Naegleria lovaniensis]
MLTGLSASSEELHHENIDNETNNKENNKHYSGLILFMRKLGKKLAFIKLLCFDKDEHGVDWRDCMKCIKNVSELTLQLMIRGEEEWVKELHVGDWIECCTKQDHLNSKSPPQICAFNYLKNMENWANNPETMIILDTLRQRYTEEETEHHKQSKRKLCNNFKLGLECTDKNCDRRHFFINEREQEQNYRDEKDPYCGINFQNPKTLSRIVNDNNSPESRFSNADLVDATPKFTPIEKLNRTRRAQIFAKYLVDQFGKDFLSSGMVLDVAGGKGEVSFYLLTEYGIQSTVIDPREATLSEKQLQKLHGTGTSIQYVHEYFTSSEQDWSDQFRELIMNSSIIVGLHPDQATEAIIDVSLRYHKPAVVVPCCVFPSLFPNRKLTSGEHVVNYVSFIEYLLEKDQHLMQLDYLPVIGMNKIVRSKPPCHVFTQ